MDILLNWHVIRYINIKLHFDDIQYLNCGMSAQFEQSNIIKNP